MHETIWRLFFRENVTKIPENASLQWDPHSKVTSPGGEHGGNKKNLARKNIFFEHETQTKKFDRSSLYIGSSRYAAQFLDRLEHFECTKQLVKKYFRENFTKFPEMLGYNGTPIVR